MKRRVLVFGLTLAALAVLVAIGVPWWTERSAEEAPTLRVEALARQDVSAVVTATGSLEAVTTVEVGCQVSGVVEALLVDFNDPVAAGQVIARIDTSLLTADVAQARANQEISAAQAAEAEATLVRVRALAATQSATAEELLAAETALRVAVAQAESARVSLDRARANLGYATIVSPVDGVVVRRDVDVGQTVNAGMSAPTLFVIAGDLSKMRILVAVDEADIGRVKQGQTVRFTVPAFGERRFEGRVDKVRLQSATVESVVTYTVEVSVDNEDRALLPGMTATVEIVVDEVLGVLCAPNAALRFSPDAALRVPEAREEATAPARGGGGGGGRGGGGRGSKGGPRKLWRVVEGGLLAPLEVQTGIQGSACTEVSGEGLSEGMEIVLGAQVSTTSTGSGSPFQQQSQSSGGWRGPRPGGF